MDQLETPVLVPKTQVSRDQPQGEHDGLQREKEDRRRPERSATVSPDLVQLLRGEAVSYRLLNDEIDPPYGLEHTTPLVGIAVSVILSIPLWGVLGLMAWAILRWVR